MAPTTVVTVLGAGYSGLTTAAELTVRGFKVNVVAYDLGKLTYLLTHHIVSRISYPKFLIFVNFFTKLKQVLLSLDCPKQSI